MRPGIRNAKTHNIPSAFYAVLAVTLILSAVIFLLVDSVFIEMRGNFESTLKQQISDQQSATITLIESHLDRSADGVEHLARMIGLPDNMEGVPVLLRRYFEKANAGGESVQGVIFLDAAGAVSAAFPPDMELFSRGPAIKDIFLFTSETRGATITGPSELQESGTVISMGYPVRLDPLLQQGGEAPGVVRGDEVNLPGMDGILIVIFDFDEFLRKSFMDTSPHIVVSADGAISPYGTDEIPKGVVSTSESNSRHPLDAVARKVLDGLSGVDIVSMSGRAHIASYSPVMFHSGRVDNRGSLFTSDNHYFVGLGYICDRSAIMKAEKTGRKINLVISLFCLTVILLLILAALLFLHRIRQEERLQEARLKAVRETAAAAAHHISQPLTAINGYVKMLQILAKEHPGEMPARTGELLGKLASSTEMIQGTVRKMVNILEHRTEEYLGEFRITVFDESAGKKNELPTGRLDN